MIKFLIIITVILIFILPILLTLWLWYFHDRHIKKIHEEILDIPGIINEQSRGRGITTAIADLQIKSAQKPLETKLKRREYKRQLFIDRAHFLSLFKIK